MDKATISITDDLELAVEDGAGGVVRKRLTPGDALDFAETLIRAGTRRMIDEEARALTDRTSTLGGPR